MANSSRSIKPESKQLSSLHSYPLSVILSFLTETEGCSLLLCRRVWAKTFLPIFRLPPDNFFDQLSIAGPKRHAHRHKFIPLPIQDAQTRLDRLNTKRWHIRKLPCCNQTTKERAKTDYLHPTAHPLLLQRNPKPTPFAPGITLLASYPRSGNTLLRTWLESITGILTCSDTRPDRPLSIALANDMQLVGEGLCQPPFTKTHWPERIGFRSFTAHRIVLVVRNPWDVLDSFWNLNVTNTHTKKVTEHVYEVYRSTFLEMMEAELLVWCDFLQFWVYGEGSKLPRILVRYEDLVREPQRQLERILKFSSGPATAIDWSPRLDTVLGLSGSMGYSSSSLAEQTWLFGGRSGVP